MQIHIISHYSHMHSYTHIQIPDYFRGYPYIYIYTYSCTKLPSPFRSRLTSWMAPGCRSDRRAPFAPDLPADHAPGPKTSGGSVEDEDEMRTRMMIWMIWIIYTYLCIYKYICTYVYIYIYIYIYI